jgi:hypothetical protein
VWRLPQRKRFADIPQIRPDEWFLTIISTATDVEGIFRLNGSAKRIKDLQEVFDSPERYGKGLDWSGYTVHDAANVLRRYLNQLPEPIVPLEFYERFREPLRIYQRQVQEDKETTDAEKFDHAKAVETYQRLIIELPPLNKQLLLYILDLLAVFASKSDQNRMPSGNLSAIFQPGMLSHPQHDMSPEEYKLSQDVLIFLIENQDHFLFGMSGTAADEQTMKEVEAGIPSRPTSHSTVRRSVSNASANTESHRKLDNIRRNVSVSSRNSRHSNNAPSPGAPTSMAAGGGVHRSNTLPSKMGPVLTSARYARANETGSSNPSGLVVSHQSSRSTSRTPSVREEPEPVPEQKPEQKHAEQPAEQQEERKSGQTASVSSTGGTAYVHTTTHGPIPPATAERLSLNETPRPQENLQAPVSPPPAVVTPSRERKLSNFFTKSPPPESEKEPRQPNRLRKKRIPGSASISAQSSTNSLHGHGVDHSMDVEPKHENQSVDVAIGDTTPRPPNTATLANRDNPSDSTPALVEGNLQHHTDHTLKPHQSRTPSMNSRSSFTDQSDLDQPDDGSRQERRENRRSWRFPRSSKRTSEQLGLGLASPPLMATNPGAEHSTSSIGSGHNLVSDPSSQPLSLDAGIQASSSAGSEGEKKSLFGKFKAKVAQVRDGVKDERERTKSPTRSDPDPSLTSQPLSPVATASEPTNGKPASVDVPREQPKEEPVRSPVSPLPGAGLPPPIPEEPHSPVAAVAAPANENLEPAQVSASESVPTSEPTISHDPPKEAAGPSTSTA